jgi:MATE family multidrug resistance protein
LSLRRELRDSFALAWPLAGAQLLGLSMAFVDNVIVARLGPGPLAAMAMAIGVISVVQVFCIGMLAPLSALVSQEVGAGRADTVGRTVHRGLMLAFMLAAVMIGCCFAAAPLLRALHQDPALIPGARSFLVALSAGVPGLLGYFALRQLTEGVGDTRPSIVIAGVAALLNVVLDYGLVYGRFGLPRLELVGSGLGTAICQWAMFIGLLAYVRFHPRYAVYHLDQGEADDGHSLREIVALGLPMSGSLLAEVGFFACATLTMGTIGVREQASHQIALNACSFLFMIPLGLSFAASIRVSRARGAEDGAGMARAGEAGTILACAIQLVSAACFFFIPERIAALYTSDPGLEALAVRLLRIAALFQLFDGVQVVTMGLLRGLLDTRVPFLVTLFSYWGVGVPSALLLAFHFGLGPSGLWYGMVIGLGTAAVLLQARFWREVRRGAARPA